MTPSAVDPAVVLVGLLVGAAVLVLPLGPAARLRRLVTGRAEARPRRAGARWPARRPPPTTSRRPDRRRRRRGRARVAHPRRAVPGRRLGCGRCGPWRRRRRPGAGRGCSRRAARGTGARGPARGTAAPRRTAVVGNPRLRADPGAGQRHDPPSIGNEFDQPLETPPRVSPGPIQPASPVSSAARRPSVWHDRGARVHRAPPTQSKSCVRTPAVVR